MISVVILSMGAVLVMQALGRVASAMALEERRGQAALFAFSKMAEVELAVRSRQPLEENSRGDFQAGEQRFEWNLSATPVADGPPGESVSLIVTWNDGRQSHEHRFDTVLGRPKGADEAL
jgi:hypothetical protein